MSLPILAPVQQQRCDLCGVSLPQTQTSTLEPRALGLPTVYTTHGAALGIVCERKCTSSSCNGVYTATYVYRPKGKGMWVYNNYAAQRYFVATSSRIYSMELLREHEQAFLQMAAPMNAYEA